MASLGYDFLKFLAAFVLITPIFKRMNVSPVLGFLLAGVLLRRTKYVYSSRAYSLHEVSCYCLALPGVLLYFIALNL
jgi:Kef-type K+ transport system membrane component KefB